MWNNDNTGSDDQHDHNQTGHRESDKIVHNVDKDQLDDQDKRNDRT